MVSLIVSFPRKRESRFGALLPSLLWKEGCHSERSEESKLTVASNFRFFASLRMTFFFEPYVDSEVYGLALWIPAFAGMTFSIFNSQFSILNFPIILIFLSQSPSNRHIQALLF